MVKATEHNQLKSKKGILNQLPIPPDQPVTSGAPMRSTIKPAETSKLPDAESRSKDKVDKCVKLFQSITNIVETFIQSGNDKEMVRNLIKDIILNQICPKTFALELEKIGINLPIIEPILNENFPSLKKAIDEREINMNWLETITIEKARETTIDKQRTIDNIQERCTTSSSTVEEQYDRIFTETPVYRSIHEIYPVDELIHLKYIYEEEKKKNDLIEKKFLKDITDIPKSLEYYRTKCDEEEQKTLEINMYLKTLETPQEVKIEENETQNNSFNYENLIEEMIFWKNKYEEKVISNQELERKFLKEVTFIPMLISYYTKNCEREEYRKSVLFDDNEAMEVHNEKDSSGHSHQKRAHSEISLEENDNKFIRLD
uniref:Uncharacterized protein n=2 Tax=Acrobeloides nanus TaxID=290746 RepID=A0A914CKI3_9BILA